MNALLNLLPKTPLAIVISGLVMLSSLFILGGLLLAMRREKTLRDKIRQQMERQKKFLTKMGGNV